jgi:3-methyladenine DNA glycosylase AlkD
MTNPFHQEIFTLIKKNSGKPKADPFLNSYLGNDHVRYPINNPTLRAIAKEWMRSHKDLKPEEFRDLLTSLIEGKSCTEKMTAGILMGYSAKDQRNFDPMIFDRWLDHLEGWVEVDTLCTGDFLTTQLPAHWPKWKKLIVKLSKDPNINKRRASLVLFCSVLGRVANDDMAGVAFGNIDRLKSEKDVLITKAISWVLRTMTKHYRERVSTYLKENRDTLPKIAVRETMVKLETGRKTK